ncbi:hypothetical protein H0H92_010660, partial [Tricholoma furcatifolium]
MPLSVINAVLISKKSFPVLVDILDSHLPRIKDLLVEHTPAFSLRRIPTITSKDYSALLSLLSQHDSPKMERLVMIGTPEFSDAVQLPDRIITRSASLKHLVLDGHGIDWELPPAFEDLKSLTIRHIPKNLQPSMVQLLGFISRLPLLETLTVADIDSHEDILPSNIEYVHMEHLENINLSSDRISVINSFFDRLSLPKNGISTVGVSFYREPQASGPHPLLQELTQRLDDITDGRVLHLKLSFHKIECWKQKQKRSEGGAPTIEVRVPHVKNVWEVQVLQSLRLDQVVYLEVNGNEYRDVRVWSLIGNLTQLEELQIYQRYTQTIVIALCRQAHILQPKTGSQATTDLAFPALTVLGINGCHFYDHKLDMRRLYGSIELRRDAELPLKRLTISNCDGI